MTTKTITGSCLCGAISVTAKAVKTSVGACHCNICRRWGGGPFMAVDCGTDVSFSNSGKITRFNSSEWAERGFCTDCGTHLFYHLKANDQYFMPAGIFDLEPELLFDHQVFIDEKPSYYDFSNDTHNMTGAEIFASFENQDN